MIKVKFYLDKADKNKLFPIHLFIRRKNIQIKVATSEKIKKKDWDRKNQKVKDSCYGYNSINKYLIFLKQETENYINTGNSTQLTDKKIKNKILSFVKKHKDNTDIKIINEVQEIYKKNKFTFIDLFAGAGGFSEGFLQAECSNKIFEFLLASDINENCELTHLARYNYQLGLSTEFLKQDITKPDFIENILKKLNGRDVDVVCGGPPCQSFSLAGKRKKFDKKDDLFFHYLKIIRLLRPKYFIMENVKGILTKESGKIREMILKEIRTIIDVNEFPKLLNFINQLTLTNKNDQFILESYYLKLKLETANEKDVDNLKEQYIQRLEKKFKNLTPQIANYKTSKTDKDINTIRHGLNLLMRVKELNQIRKKVINEKAFCDIDNDFFVNDIDNFLTIIDDSNIIQKIRNSFNHFKIDSNYNNEVNKIIIALEIYSLSFDECLEKLGELTKLEGKEDEFNKILSEISLYKIVKPYIALASDYGVPQDRERVLFIGCRKDQKLISEIPPTLNEKEKVNVFEAIYDLDFIENDDEKIDYEKIDILNKYNGLGENYLALLKRRNIDGKIDENTGMTYSNWSRNGRLNHRFNNMKPSFYVRNFEELQNEMLHIVSPLQNHKTSKQNDDVIKRLKIILHEGDYEKSKQNLKKAGLDSEKRNYNVLNPLMQSPTIMTIPDDYIHYSVPRALTVREMARLQSFDDSFVFQGKRSTGGNKRKSEVPQFTLVGNAIPPLLARAIAMEVLKNIA